MIRLPPEIHRAVHDDLARGERAHDAMMIDLNQGCTAGELRALLLAMATAYERAAQRIGEVDNG